ncbi:hypothetical protein BHE74_00055966 [Ensete ventricosum]|uniref:Uncharacterized protein n=1 Tax=Ensete ventricosum TaxID=4639 RepID=A0A426ZP66_ENSVE|nr:hypothetical protein B296_00040067 [Ensete ventricosum]RWW38771.1 hypothetical protein BHE74_00055966 [Ensete ventricosum]
MAPLPSFFTWLSIGRIQERISQRGDPRKELPPLSVRGWFLYLSRQCREIGGGLGCPLRRPRVHLILMVGGCTTPWMASGKDDCGSVVCQCRGLFGISRNGPLHQASGKGNQATSLGINALYCWTCGPSRNCGLIGCVKLLTTDDPRNRKRGDGRHRNGLMRLATVSCYPRGGRVG